ncbi:PREDICTED: protein FAM188B2 [Lepidothrix coronata]|uniref:Ubiquitin carboxyl-terminal hydrolase MINDY n=1 Tax=Lepidothrix coronata TaxID=321398 RepID=A0A6J0IW61_9PASS|nr:PREDICTED: protein FAM188B2 [Lepidothrix coronata]
MKSLTEAKHPLCSGVGLQKLLFGNTTPLFSCEWAAAHFRFRQPHSDLAYALQAGKGGTRAVLMAVQAHIITYLLFTRDTEYTHLDRLCQIGRREQGQALAVALAETLWAAGGGGRAVVCLTTTAGTAMPRAGCRADALTDRIRLFEFPEKAAAQEFISHHINCAVLSLLLTGRASPRELGGGAGEVRGQRGPVGFLRWERAAERQVSPALRTPRLPVWLCGVPGRHGVLFGTDPRLLSHWRAERLFHLYFYSGQQEQTRTAHLTIVLNRKFKHTMKQDCFMINSKFK